jgi:RND superfamily putative drug exporter
VTSAGLILAATFGAAGVTGATSQIKQLGAAIALGVLIDTFLVRTLMVPAIVVLCRRFNWWPSHLARRDAQLTAGTRPAAVKRRRRPRADHHRAPGQAACPPGRQR